ncbi:MAG: hypothetical protein L0Z62_07580 [Gemmataceae bacterium]|nr:hypothetical protein [Gemmataceae bacterium]
MLTKLFAGLFVVVGLSFAGAASAQEKPAPADCCAKKLACCSENRACCVAPTRLGCCQKGQACCAKDSACCKAPQECCRTGSACCDRALACCGPTTAKTATSAVKGCCAVTTKAGCCSGPRSTR